MRAPGSAHPSAYLRNIKFLKSFSRSPLSAPLYHYQSPGWPEVCPGWVSWSGMGIRGGPHGHTYPAASSRSELAVSHPLGLSPHPRISPSPSDASSMHVPSQELPSPPLCSILCVCLVTGINAATNNAVSWVLICQTQCAAVIPNTLTFSHEIISIFSD